jgi:hypothetical protein
MFLNVLVMGGVAWAAIRVARHLRAGRSILADAFFPIILLNIGNWPNLFWCWQFTFVLPTALTYAILLVLISQPMLATPASAVIVSTCLVSFPFCGANGLLFVPFLAPWLAYCGLLNLKRGTGQRWISVLLIGLAAVAVCLIGVYFIGYHRPTWNPQSPGIGASLKTAGKLLAFSFGPIASKSWATFFLAAFVVFVPSFALVAMAVLRHEKTERQRALGLLLFFSILVVFALATGHGRAGLIPSVGFPIRYVIFAVPFFFTAFFAWELYGPSRLRTIVQNGLFLSACVLLPLNSIAGFEMFGNWYDDGMDALERDINEGAPRALIVKRHGNFLIHWWDEGMLTAHIQMLYEDQVGPFSRVREEAVTQPHLQEVQP